MFRRTLLQSQFIRQPLLRAPVFPGQSLQRRGVRITPFNFRQHYSRINPLWYVGTCVVTFVTFFYIMKSRQGLGMLFGGRES